MILHSSLNTLPTPCLFLAPMEGITNPLFRELIAELGSVDVLATEFIRITGEKQKVRPFYRHEDKNVRLQIQFMAGDAKVIAGNIRFLKDKGVLFDSDWIDLNVGCPSKRVNAHGAGAALLKTPERIVEIMSAMREAHSGVLSLKTRLGFETKADFPNLLEYLKQAPIDLLTLHARSRCGGYDEPISLEYLQRAREALPIPVVGNGDIWNVEDALEMLRVTGVWGLMCGRGAIRNPFIFREIRSALDGKPWLATQEDLFQFLMNVIDRYAAEESPQRRLSPVFKELAGWISKNPLVGKEYFVGIRRANSMTEVREATELFFRS